MSAPMSACPSCGSPLAVESGRCAFCHAPLSLSGRPTDGSTQWAPPAAGTAFSMQVADVFTIRGRGTVATGTVATGSLRVGDALLIDGPAGAVPTTCTGIETFRKQQDSAGTGDNVGILLSGVDKTHVAAGSWLRAATA